MVILRHLNGNPINENSGIESPQDLQGKRVGLVEYQMTAALWIRAFLEEDYGVHARDILWHTGGLIEPEWAERIAVPIPADVNLRQIPGSETLEGMLKAGELDALVTMQPPQGFREASEPVRRLFDNHEATEREYHQRTGHFPIMHLVVIRREVYERNRWMALSLFEAFEQAKKIGNRRLRAITGLAVSLPWLSSALHDIDVTFDGDAFPYGVQDNIHTLEAMTTYVYEQGMSGRKVDVGELFAAESYQNPIAL